jgi:outer membrane protein TolC
MSRLWSAIVAGLLAAASVGPVRAADGGVPPLPVVPPEPLAVPPAVPGGGVPVAPAERLTLDAAVRRALARNPTVATAQAEVARAQALVTEARGGWLPTLVGNGAYTRLDRERHIMTKDAAGMQVQGAVISHKDQFAGNLLLTVPLIAPQGWTATREAKDNERIATASAVDVRRVIAQATATTYLTVLAQHRQIRSTEAALANARAHALFAHTRLKGGVGNSLDDARAQQDVAVDEVQLQQVYGGLLRAREALGVLVGADGPIDAANDVTPGDVPTLSVALEDARARRPDIVAQQDRVTAAEHLRKDVWAAYAPYLAAVGQPFVQEGNQLQPRTGWQAQLLLTLPIYDGGVRSGQARFRDALLDQARLNLEATLRQAQSEVRIAFEAMLRADRALASARIAAELARKAYELATLAYRAGSTTNLDVIDAAHRVRDADGDVAQAEDVARRARLDLLVSSGRFP